jgi:uncharacterized membrane-anchored protein
VSTKARLPLILLAIVFLIQWAVPVSMILGRERVLEQGTEVKFSVQPVDPYDPFRGRYVRINARPVIDESSSWPEGLKRGERVFAIIEPDDQGFAQATEVVADRPQAGLYLQGKALWPRSRSLDFGLDRYYMNEKMAPATERLVGERLQTGAEVHITVRILDGDSVITGLYVDGVAVEEIIATAE